MAVYEWRCPECRQAYATRRPLGDTTPPTCPPCQTPVKRRYSPFAIQIPMQEHYNHSVGAYITNERQFKDQLKIQSEAATLRTGLEHNFVPHDPRDAKDSLGVTDEGLEATYRRRRELGLVTGEETHSLSGKRPVEVVDVVETADVVDVKPDVEEVLWLE